MKTNSKKVLISFLLMFTLIISLFAMSPLIANAANIDAGSVSVNNKAFSATRLYYKNGADDVTNDSEDYNAYFNPETNTLTLKNYEGDAIAIGGAIQEDVTIVLIGTNIITTSDQKAISSTNGGGIFITAESEASLTINCTAGQSAIYGIYTGSWGNGVLDISGNADVTINVNSTRNDSSVYGAYIDGTIDIKDNAKLSVNTSSLNPLSGYSVGMGLYAKQGITFETTSKVLVNTSGIPSENGNYGIYSDVMVNLKKAEELKIVVSAGSYATPVYPAANTQNWTGFQASTHVDTNVLTTTYTPIVTHTVTFNSNGGNGEMASVPVVENGTYELPACGFTAPTGYEFKCWSVNEDEKAVGDELTITAATTVKAVWKVKSYTITFNTNGGTTIAAITQDYNTAVQAPANPTKEGHTFKQWDKAIPATMPAENLTITAEWDINQYTITFNTDGGNAIAPITQDYGTAVVAPANPTKSGYTFTGWDKTIPSTMPAENMTITAQWTEFVPNTYTVTYTDGVDGVELFADQVTSNVTEGAATPTFNGTPVREGYTFAGWTPSVADTVTANATYTATWTINQYTITFNTDGGSTIAPITQDYGTAVVAPANPTKSGYTFTGWDKTIPSTMPAENMTITAQWTEFVPNTYTVTYTDGVDDVELFADQVNANITEGAATPAFNGTPVREGYTFAGWTPSVADTVTANATYTATWTINQYTITFNTDGGSTIDPITQNYGTAVVAPADPTKSGYTFAGWDKTIPSTMPAENVTITASWTLIPVHEHTDADGQWESDGTYHWHTCSCTEQFDKVACSGGTATCTAKAVCTVCNNEYGNTTDEHTYGAWTSNGDGTHTRVCSLNAEHKENGDCAGGTATCTEKAVCATCNTAYGNTAAHSHGSEWKTDANEHWNECACGDKANKAAHTDSNNDGKCDTCDYQMTNGGGNTETPDNPNNTPDNPNNTPDDPNKDKDGLGAGAIVGVVIGSVAVAGVGGFALFWFVIKKKSFADLIAVFKKK